MKRIYYEAKRSRAVSKTFKTNNQTNLVKQNIKLKIIVSFNFQTNGIVKKDNKTERTFKL